MVRCSHPGTEGIDMTDTPDAQPDLPPSLRFLKGLVITLMITMIVGVITVVWLLVTRMPDGSPAAPTLPPPALPADLTLPEGLTAEAVTFGKGWTAVVTTDQQILIFGPDGALAQRLQITVPVSP
jgi:hypothetical protein